MTTRAQEPRLRTSWGSSSPLRRTTLRTRSSSQASGLRSCLKPPLPPRRVVRRTQLSQPQPSRPAQESARGRVLRSPIAVPPPRTNSTRRNFVLLSNRPSAPTRSRSQTLTVSVSKTCPRKSSAPSSGKWSALGRSVSSTAPPETRPSSARTVPSIDWSLCSAISAPVVLLLTIPGRIFPRRCENKLPLTSYFLVLPKSKRPLEWQPTWAPRPWSSFSLPWGEFLMSTSLFTTELRLMKSTGSTSVFLFLREPLGKLLVPKNYSGSPNVVITLATALVWEEAILVRAGLRSCRACLTRLLKLMFLIRTARSRQTRRFLST